MNHDMMISFLFICLLSLSYGSYSLGLTAGPFAINVKVSVKPERRAEFLDAIGKDAAQTLATEPGALQFTLGEDTETKNVFHFHEQYKTLEDIKHHQSMKHFAEYQSFCESDPFTEDPVFHTYQCKHDPIKIAPRPAFCLNVELCVQTDFRDEFLEVIDNNQKGSRKEPLCLQYDYGESIDEPNSFYFHEEYTGKEEGKEGFDAHSVAPHFQKWEEFAAKDPFTKPPIVNFFKSIL